MQQKTPPEVQQLKGQAGTGFVIILQC